MKSYDHMVHLLTARDYAGFEAELATITDGSVLDCLRGFYAEHFSRLQDAHDYFQSALSMDSVPRWVTEAASVRLIFSLISLGEIESAIILGEKTLLKFQALKPYPFDRDIELKSILANAYSSRGEFVRAISLTADKPSHPGPRAMDATWGWARSVVLFQLGMVDEALHTNLEAIDSAQHVNAPLFLDGMNDNTYWYKCVLGEPLTEAEFTELTERCAQLNIDEASVFDVESFLVLAYVMAVRGDSVGARNVIDHLSRSNNLRGPGIVRAATVLDTIGDRDATFDAFRRAVVALDTENHPHLVASVWNKLARMHEENGDVKSALECMKAAVDAIGVQGDPNANPYCITM